MNILHIGKYHPPFHGGIENFMFDLMNEQAVKRHNVQAIVHHHERDKRFNAESFDNVVIHRVPTHGSLVFVPIAPSFGKHLLYVIDAFQPDVIHMHMPNVSCFWALFSKKAKSIPWVIHWHSDVVGAVPDWRVKLLYPFYRFFEKALLKRSEQVIATSQPYLDSSEALADFSHKCKVVELGIKAQAVSIDSTSGNHPLKLLCIGRLTYYKGHEILLSALSQVAKGSFSLTIVGTGELESSLKAMVDELNLSAQVQFMGALSNEQLTAELEGCDLLCLPSIERTEAFGVVLLEAMRAAKPCLVTDVEGSGMSWVVQDGKTGFVVKAGSVEALATKFSDIANNKGVLPELGNNGRIRFENQFTIEQVSSKIDAIYQQLVDK